MTREEAIRKAINIVRYFEAHFAKSKEAREDAVNIIEALEQEPKEETWSIKEVADALERHGLLERETSYNSVKIELNDCISREETKNLMCSLTRWCVKSEDRKYENVGLLYDDVMFGIDRLPSVQPKAEQEPKTDRLYSWLNDMRLGIAPDETTPKDERAERLAQVDVIDDIMKWLENNEQWQMTDKDCISRQAVLDAFADYVGSGMGMDDFDALWNIVANIQPANPKEPKTGQEPCEDATLKDIFCMGCEYREQEPKTVIYSGDGYADGYMVYDMAECPSCGYEYEDGDKDWGENFCPHCGQALIWESEE